MKDILQLGKKYLCNANDKDLLNYDKQGFKINGLFPDGIREDFSTT